MTSVVQLNDQNELLCPLCGGNCLHQRTARVVFRDCEDGPGTLAESSSDGVHIRRVEDKQISGRRDAMAIQFSCEDCSDAVVELTVMQHKGSTLVTWSA